jgi:predicted  nucleic acid-binding Zn-ribbon protein
MTIELGKEEKTQIINSHKRNLAYSKYNLEIDILQENAKSAPSAAGIANIQDQISDINNQISALDAELAAVEAA